MRKKFVASACLSLFLLTACGGEKAVSENTNIGATEGTTAIEDVSATEDISDIEDAYEEETNSEDPRFLKMFEQKDEFKSYDEVISNLTKGNGYAYIKLYGYDEELLIVTDYVYTDDNKDSDPPCSSYVVFAKDGNVVRNIAGYYFYGGRECPLAVGEGMLYSCKPDEIVSYTVYDDRPDEMFLVHMEFAVKDYDKNGNPYYYGFISDPENRLSTAIEIDSEEVYTERLKKYLNAKEIKFKVKK